MEFIFDQIMLPKRSAEDCLKAILELTGVPTVLDPCLKDLKELFRIEIENQVFGQGPHFRERFKKKFPTRELDQLGEIRHIILAEFDLLEGLLKLNPSERLSIDEALRHPFLEGIYEDFVEEPVVSFNPLEFDFENFPRRRREGKDNQDIRCLIYHEIKMYHYESERELHKQALDECEGNLHAYLLKNLRP